MAFSLKKDEQCKTKKQNLDKLDKEEEGDREG